MKVWQKVLKVSLLSFVFFCSSGVFAAVTSVNITQASTATVSQGAADQALIRIEVVSTTAETVNRFRYEPQGDLATDFPNLNIYYTGTSPVFAATNLFGGTIANPGIGNATNQTGTQAIPAGTVYFWIAADISAAAIGGNSIDMEFKNIRTVSGGTTNFGAATNPAGVRLVATSPMAYSSINVFQASTADVYQGNLDNPIIGVEVITTGASSPISVTDLEFNLGGTTTLADLASNIKVYYTGNSNSFATGNLFATNGLPGGTFGWTLFNGAQVLVQGSNYFWFTCDIDAAATLLNVVDGRCRRVTVDGTDVLSSTVQNPAGNRIIKAVMPGPGGLGNGLTLWLDAKNGAELGGLAATNTNNVDLWTNKSGTPGTPNLNQNTANRQPVFFTNSLNFNPVITFDGNNDKLKRNVLGSDLFAANNNTIVLVHRFNSGIVYFKWESGPSGNRVGFESLATKTRFDFPTDGLGNQNISTFDYDNNGQIVSAITVPGNSVLRNMGLPEAPEAITGSLTLNQTNELAIGENVTFTAASDIDYAEIVVFNRTLNAAELNKVESYLAIKYGMTLGINGMSLDYNSTLGTTIWDVSANNGYNYDIGGISRDDNSDQDQRKSKSINLNGGVSSDILTVANGTNFANPVQMANNSHFVWGHNNGPTINTGAIVNIPSDNGQNIEVIFQRHWKSQETGTVTDVTLEFDMSAVIGVDGVVADNDLAALVLLVDEDGDFTNGATAYFPSSYNNTTNIAYFQHDFMPSNGNNAATDNGFFFTLGSINVGTTILPVEIAEFTASCVSSNQININWITKSEINNDYFILEKSTDGSNWETITTIDGSGNSNSTLNYSYTDYESFYELTYYRLKQVDFNGKVTYVGMNKAICDKNNNVNVYPNPFSDKITISYNTNLPYTVELYDPMGRIVFSQFVDNTEQSVNIISVPEDIAKGIYYLTIIQNNTEVIYSNKIIKK